jgi:S1-C subfamily serine protease
VKVVNAARDVEGSGVVVKCRPPHVYVLTAAHVVRGAKAAEVRSAAGGKARAYKDAEVLAASPAADLAVVRFATRDDLPALPLFPAGSKPADRPAAFGVGWEKGDAPTAIEETVLAGPPRAGRSSGSWCPGGRAARWWTPTGG